MLSARCCITRSLRVPAGVARSIDREASRSSATRERTLDTARSSMAGIKISPTTTAAAAARRTKSTTRRWRLSREATSADSTSAIAKSMARAMIQNSGTLVVEISRQSL